jgi:hypothetical protein
MTYPITGAGYIGSTEGIPLQARDRANRAILDYEYSSTLQEYLDPENDLDKNRLKELLIGMSDLNTRLNGFAVTGDLDSTGLAHIRGSSVDGTPFLMLFSMSAVAGPGNWILSINSPDTAQTIVLTVPGVGRGVNDHLFEDLGNLDATINGVLGQGAVLDQTALILWDGYDAPPDPIPGPIDTLNLNTAADAAGGLQAFQRGLSATRQKDAPAPHITVVGHSFGSCVVGETTLAGRKLVADDVIIIGSPGVPVDNAAALAMNTITSALPSGKTQVWASLTGKDEVKTLWGLPVHALGLGNDPMTKEFGATIFKSDPEGNHGGYWQTDGLANLARIELGKYSSVTPP